MLFTNAPVGNERASVQNVGVIFFQKGMYIIRNENIIPDIFYNKECCNIFFN